MARFTVSIDDHLLYEIDEFADNNGMTRSGFVSLACKQYLLASSTAPAFTKMVESLGSLFEKANALPKDEIEQQLDVIETKYNQLLNGSNK